MINLSSGFQTQRSAAEHSAEVGASKGGARAKDDQERKAQAVAFQGLQYAFNLRDSETRPILKLCFQAREQREGDLF